jgi:epoxyqueuosine reductase
MGNWVFGCDICQDVCPFQRFARNTGEKVFYPADFERAAPRLLDLLALDDTQFKARYKGTPIDRIGRERLVRNACIASGNWRDLAALPILAGLLGDRSPLVRGHAAWAMGRIASDESRRLLTMRLGQEDDSEVITEITAALSGLSSDGLKVSLS